MRSEPARKYHILEIFWHAERLTPNSIDARSPPVARIVKGRQTHSFWVKQILATNGPEMHELKNIIYIVNVILGDFFLMFYNYVVWCMFSYSVKGRKWHNKNSDKSSKPATTKFGASCVHLRFPPLDILLQVEFFICFEFALNMSLLCTYCYCSAHVPKCYDIPCIT